MEDENFFEKCRTCQHCYTKNDDDYVYCRKRNEKCEYKPYKLRGRKNEKRSWRSSGRDKKHSNCAENNQDSVRG